AHAEGLGADEAEADGNPQRHHGCHRADHHPGDPAWDTVAGEASQVPRQAMYGQRGGNRPGLDRAVPGRAPLRVEASLRGLAVILEAGGEGGRADRAAVGADEVRSGLAAFEVEGASEAPRELAPL